MSKLIPHWKPTWGSPLVKEWELRMEPSCRISVHRCRDSLNSLLEVICWKVSYFFIVISRLLADPSHTALLWGCLGVSLYHWESTEPFLISLIRGRESLTSVWCSEGLTWVPLPHQCLYPAAQQMGLSQTLQHRIQAWAGWAVRALCIHWIAIKVSALVDGQVWSPVPWQLGWDHWSHQLNYPELMTCGLKVPIMDPAPISFCISLIEK